MTIRSKTPPELTRLPPHSLEAEQGLLGSILSGANVAEVVDVVPVDAFYDLKHREIYQALVDLWDKQCPIDALSVGQHLKAVGKLDESGGYAYIGSLPDASPSAHNWPYSAEIINEHLVRRRAIQVGAEIVSQAYEDNGVGVAQLLDTVEKALMSLAPKNHGKQKDIKALVHEAIGVIEEWHSNQGKLPGLTTGLMDLDKITGGLMGKKMYVIAGRPSVGKTTLAMNIADHVAVELGLPVGVFSLEMADLDLVIRLLCARARVVLTNMQEGFMTERDFPKLTGAASKLANTPIFLDDTSGLTIMQLRSRARQWAHRHKIRLLVIDYLQLVHGTNKRDSRERQVAEISLGIKEIAKELEIPVIALAQLNRSSEKENRKPQLSDLRESGEIEADADFVGLLYQKKDEEADEDQESVAVDMRVAKQRNGPTGTVHLTFLRNLSRFENASRVDDDDMPSVRQGDNIKRKRHETP